MSSRPAPAARPRTTEPGSGRRGTALTARGVALLVVALVSVGSVVGPLRSWVDQRSDLTAARADVAERRERVADLQAQSDRWDDPAYVAAQARARLQYVEPGETRYVVLGAPASAAPSETGAVPGVTAAPTATPTPGATSLLQRVREGLGIGADPTATPTPTPADIAPSTPPPSTTATPGAP